MPQIEKISVAGSNLTQKDKIAEVDVCAIPDLEIRESTDLDEKARTLDRHPRQ